MLRVLFLTIVLAVAPLTAYAHNHEDVKVEKVKVSKNIFMIMAGGGNVGVSVGEDALFIIDSSIEETSQAVLEKIKEISDKPIKILANTHWHYDHVGGNENFDTSDAVIIAHHNVYTRMKEGGTIAAFSKEVDPALNKALPRITVDGKTLVHTGKESVELISVDPAHTDGDMFVVWPESNVIHTGDILFNGFYPFIDAGSGGSLKGIIAAARKIYDLADEDTKIIPGHGPLANKEDLRAYIEMLEFVDRSIETAKGAKLSKSEWMETKPLAAIDKEWGSGFLSTAIFMSIAWSASGE